MSRPVNYSLFVLLFLSFVSAPVQAVPVNGLFLPAMHCDGPMLNVLPLTHEIGDGTAANPFPINERISVSVTQLPAPIPPTCVGDDGVINDYLVRITNLSSVQYQDLHFVADELTQTVLGNYDGRVQDLSNPNAPPTLAMRIDGTVTPGVNNPLISEFGGIVNEIFEPGETWSFYVINFTTGVPRFGSVGAFGTGSITNPASTASILANPVPEPTTAGTLGLGLLLAWVRFRNGVR